MIESRHRSRDDLAENELLENNQFHDDAQSFPQVYYTNYKKKVGKAPVTEKEVVFCCQEVVSFFHAEKLNYVR